MRETEQMARYTCNGCGRTRITGLHEEPEGFHGIATEVTSAGGSERVDWYACGPRCVGKAVVKAIAETRDERPEQADDQTTTALDTPAALDSDDLDRV